MRILVTGSGGMLGQDVVLALARGHDVLGLDHAACDITDVSAVRQAFADWHPDLVVNCAAFPNVDGCERDPERAFAVNGRGPGLLARAAEAAGARLLHIGTDYVFDGTKYSPYYEDDPTNPVSIYGKSKLEGERQVFGQNEALSRHMVLRTSWLFGIHGANFVEKVLADAQSRDRLPVVVDQISAPTWTVHMAQRIGELAARPATGILHVAASGECSRYEFASYIVSGLSRHVTVEPIRWADLKLPAKRPAYSVLGSRRLKELNLAPLPHWREAVDEYVRLRQVAPTAAARHG